MHLHGVVWQGVRKINRTPSGLLAVLGEPLVGKPKFRTPLYRTVWNGEADGESALQPSSLFCHTHTAPSLRGGGKRHNGSDSWRHRRHRRSGIVDPASSIRHRRLGHRPSRGRGAYQAGEGAPYPWLCAGAGSMGELGVRGIEVLSARRGGCVARRGRHTERLQLDELAGPRSRGSS